MRHVIHENLLLEHGPLEFLTSTVATPWLMFDQLASWQKRWLRARACSLSYPKAVLSGWSAADVLGIGVLARHDDLGEVCLTYSSQSRSRSTKSLGPGIRFSSRILPPEQIVEIRGVRCTSLVRTFVDIQYYYGELEALCFIESALTVVNGLTKEWVEAQLRSLGGIRGVVGAQKTLSLAYCGVGSVMETYLRYLIYQACRKYRGLIKTIEVQARIATPEGDRFPDLLINGWLIVEFDGVGKYGETVADFRRAKRKEEHRQLLLLKQGFRIVRCTYQDVGPAVIEVIVAMLAERRQLI